MTKVTATLGKQLRYLALTQSAAVTEESVEPISTCKRLEVLDLQGTRIEVKERVTAVSTAFLGCRSCFTVG